MAHARAYVARVGRVNGKGRASEDRGRYKSLPNTDECGHWEEWVLLLSGLPSAIDSEQPVAIMAFNLCEPGMPERIELILKRIIEILRLSPCFSGDVRKAL